jgi:toxin ParE1/3/4
MAAERIWRPKARNDLLEIYIVISRDNPVAAEKIVDAIETRTGYLAEHPRMGQRRSEIRPSVRVLVERPYLVLYEPRPDTDDGPIDTVEIVRVIDGRRDLTGPF